MLLEASVPSSARLWFCLGTSLQRNQIFSLIMKVQGCGAPKARNGFGIPSPNVLSFLRQDKWERRQVEKLFFHCRRAQALESSLSRSGVPCGCPGDLSHPRTLLWQPKGSLSAQHQHCWDRQSKRQREGNLLCDMTPKWAEERWHHPAELKEAETQQSPSAHPC